MPKRWPIIPALLTWIASVAFYLALISSYGPREFVAAALTAILSTAAAVVFSRSGKVVFHLRWRDIVQGWRLIWYAFSGTFEVLQGLFQQLFTAKGAASVVAAVPFDLGDKQNIADAGRRALATSYTSATPNFVILGYTDQEHWLLYHQIVPGEVLTMTEKLGARP
jgi:multisubunit Na+/H+ antiporter MnhE subunit